jgi:prefoldin subunit 5
LTLQECAEHIENQAQVIEHLIRENNKLHVDVESLQATVSKLTRRIEEVYYAPGMPGYVEAEVDFASR